MKVANYYNENVTKEFSRLNQDFYSSLEKKIVLHLIKKYFPKKAKILDVGGGPGTYSQELLELGSNASSTKG
ncbi:MAG: hypothetical protein KAX49_03485 [Halanaerobiales bacterium]|nr:hypothetical protein [Halanaerobiales bacterium]